MRSRPEQRCAQLTPPMQRRKKVQNEVSLYLVSKCQKVYSARGWPYDEGESRSIAEDLEIFLEVEVAGQALGLRSGRGAVLLLLLLCAGHDTSLLVVTNALLEEVGLASKRDVLHEVEGVGSVVMLGVAQSQQQAVSDELNVLAHKASVHAEQSTRESVRQELLFDCDGLGDDGCDSLLAWAVVQQGEEKASKVCVHALVTRDELVGECETGHETTLLQPENGRERTTEEDTLDGGKSNKAVGEGRVLVGDPSQGPISLLTNAGN